MLVYSIREESVYVVHNMKNIIVINQRFIVWKLNNTNVDWKNTATVLNCVSAGWQDEEERLPISIFWASLCFAGDSESYNPLWNLERSTGHVYDLYDRKYLLSRTLWLFQRVQTKFRIGTDSGTDPSGMQRRPPFTNMKIQIPVVPQEKIIKI